MSQGIFLKGVSIELVNKYLNGLLGDSTKVDVKKVAASDKIKQSDKIYCGWYKDDNISMPKDGICMNCSQPIGDNPCGVPLEYVVLKCHVKNEMKYISVVDCERQFHHIRCCYTYLKRGGWYSEEQKKKSIDILLQINGKENPGKPLIETRDPVLLKVNGGSMDNNMWLSEESTTFHATEDVHFVPTKRLYKKLFSD